MYVTTTELQNNFGKYLKIVEFEDIIVTKNSKNVAFFKKYEPIDSLNQVIREGTPAYSTDQRLKVSYEDFLKIIEDSNNRYEYINGELYLLASPVYKHQRIVRKILSCFDKWFENKPCEPLDSTFDVTLTNCKEKNVVQPDVLVICDTENIDEKGKYHGIPTLVVEILSPSTHKKDFVEKLNLYSSSGVKEYWIIDPDSKTVFVYYFKDRNIDRTYAFKGDEYVESVVFNGLQISVKELFG